MSMKLRFSPLNDDDELIAAIEPDKFIEQLDLDVVRVSSSGKSSCCCPLHDEENPSFVINLDPEDDDYLRWTCFHEGDAYGDAIELIARVKEVDREKARELAFEWFDFSGVNAPDLDDVIALMEKGDRPQRKLYRIPLPRTGDDTTPIIKYLVDVRKSGYTEEDAVAIIDKWGLKFTREGYYQNRIIIPMLDSNGKQVYFQAQAVDNSVAHFEPPRNKAKLFPGGASTNHILHGLHDLDSSTIIVVEGFWDAVYLRHHGLPAVMASSASLSDTQISLLIEHANKVIIWFDNDEKKGKRNVGQEEANTACQKIMDAGLIAYRVKGPPNVDPDEVGDQARDIIRHNSIPYRRKLAPAWNEIDDLLW